MTAIAASAGCAGGDGAAPAPVAPPPPRAKVASSPPIVPVTPPPRKEWAPPAAKRPVVHEYWGTKVTDDYEWLEDASAQEVKDFTATQNDAARKFLDGLPQRPAVRARLAQLYEAGGPSWLDARWVKGAIFVLEDKPPKQQPIIVTRNENADASSERVVLDPNVLDPTGKTTVDMFEPSPDGRFLAVSLSKGGSESGDVHVFDVFSGKEKFEVVTHAHGGTAGGSLAWNADSSGFWYTRYPRAGERPAADMDFYQQVWFHRLGRPESMDTYSVGKDFPRIAEVELARSDDGRYVVARVANGDGGEYEHHFIDVKAAGANPWKRLTTFADEITTTAWGADGKLYAISRKGASRGKVVAFTPPFDAPPEDVFPESETVIEDIVVTKSALYLVELAGGPSRLRRVPLNGKPEPLAREPSTPKKGGKGKGGAPAPAPKPEPPVSVSPGERGLAAAEIPLPPVSSITVALRMGDDLLVRDETFLEPASWYRYRANEHRLVKTDMTKAPPADMSDVEVVRETCTSKDGTKVPMSVLRKKGQKLDGSIPTLLTGYGGYGVSQKPRLRPWYRAWLDKGGVMAIANLRGGGEMGEDWHKAGKLTKKQNVFDDFFACGKELVSLGYTRADHLAITGRSNGGLLMGAALVQHPEMFRVVVSGVGIYDMLRVENTPNGAFNVTEFGTVKDEAQYRAMQSYSPFHNVHDGVAYPSVLFVTGANDPRVDPYHSRKMTARLQAATSSDRPVLLRASNDTGHGMGTPLGAMLDELADTLAFTFHELGVP